MGGRTTQQCKLLRGFSSSRGSGVNQRCAFERARCALVMPIAVRVH
jgi:hypothetical protein